MTATATLFVEDIDAPGSGPVLFGDGASASGLTYTFTSLGSTIDDIAFPAHGGATFAFTPVLDAAGYDEQVTHIRINPKSYLAGSDGSNHPSLSLKFKTRVR